jgi:hypothetical protein
MLAESGERGFSGWPNGMKADQLLTLNYNDETLRNGSWRFMQICAERPIWLKVRMSSEYEESKTLRNRKQRIEESKRELERKMAGDNFTKVLQIDDPCSFNPF